MINNEYGRIWYGGAMEYAHRMSWVIRNGPIPDGKYVLHRCDNPPCVNPDHLFLGTQLDNIQDRHDKGRNGHGQNSSLEADDIRAIRFLQKLSEPQLAIADFFEISNASVSNIVRRITWAHVM